MIRTSLQNNKQILIFLTVIFIIGILAGIVIFSNLNSSVKDSISLELNNFSDIILSAKQNQILFHSIVIALIFLLSFTVIGNLLGIFYLFYEGCSFGFSLSIFFFKFKTTGILFSLLFNIITKLIFLLIIIYICVIGFKVAKRIIGSLILKKDELTYRFIKKHLSILAIVLVITVINDTLIYFFGNKILSIFLFLL